MSRRMLYWVFFLALVVRIAVFLMATITPIRDSEGVLVSPLLPQTTVDTLFYQQSAQQYASFDFGGAIQKFKAFYESPTHGQGYILALPVFPLMLHIFNYVQGNTLPLAFFFLCICIVLSWLWLYWLNEKQLPGWSLWLFAVLLNPIWFMLAVSTDLIFALTFAIFFILYFREPVAKRSIVWVIPLLVMLLTRPNGVSILLFVLWDKFYNDKNCQCGKTFKIMALVILVPISLFLWPYFQTFLGASSSFSFLNIASREYMAGLFSWLPDGINQFVSWICFAGAKVLYFVGLRPSYGHLSWILILLRALPGIILLPGVIYLLFKGDKRHKMLFLLYFLPVFLGASQDRYNLPVQPMLYYYGVLCLVDMKNKLFARKE